MDLPALYHEWTVWIGDGTGLPDAILHIHAGLAILILVRLITRRSLGTFIPFSAVVVAEVANEIMDYLAYGMRWPDTLADFGNTLFWPFVISLGVRLRPMVPPEPRKQSDTHGEAPAAPDADAQPECKTISDVTKSVAE